jgi:cyclopropane fatty-acyl-phospholipid synthase-like methyltransferase
MARALADTIKRAAPPRRPLSILEIGGGNSCFLQGLMDEFQFREYQILDNSAEGMRRARERFEPAYGERVRYLEADVFEPAQGFTGRFDVVLSVGLIEHFSDEEIPRLVKLHADFAAPDGVVIIAVPTPTVLYWLVRGFAELVGIWQFPDERPIPRGRLVEMMKNAGLRIVWERTFWSQILTQALVAGVKTP